ncbi:Protein translocase subunit SECA2 chloroplastic [Heracleum sosnowskyi]|uniref:Protein translocase subunit SECA2 chloroplastic n=1 Tax=Heracleum sosnowskyi TaxID=360622 RepID=A0AAD8J7A4_9APIA|nr:Protein translocase subunit SECA2 chloroplastic [Heracleum sosnowskyi]
MESPSWPELPECPVCLQYYDGACTTPRVLSCGHSTCEACLTQLPNPFPQTIRCPACTQLVKFPQNISSLPKNIDLLRLSSLLQNPEKPILENPKKPIKELSEKDDVFMPNLWSQDFYFSWKDWILSEDCVVVDDFGGANVGPAKCLMKENGVLGLVKVGGLVDGDEGGVVFSYVGKILRVLCGMSDGERDELGLILRESLRWSRVCEVFGLWYNEGDQGVYVVCESQGCKVFDKLDGWEKRFSDEGDGDVGLRSDVVSGVLMIGLEMCEAVMSLHLEGLSFGCLGLSCFSFDCFGHACVEFGEVMTMGGSLNKMIARAIFSKQKIDCKELEAILNSFLLEGFTFVSPEMFLELMRRGGANLGPGFQRYVVGYGSDVWSLACVVIWLLVGKPFIEEFHSYISCLLLFFTDKEIFNFEVMYMGWLEKVKTLLDTRLKLESTSLKDHLIRCLNFDLGTRPDVVDIWKCIRGMLVDPKFDMAARQTMSKGNMRHCLVIGEICPLIYKIMEGPENQIKGVVQETCEVVEQVENLRIDPAALPEGHVKCIDLDGHLDCITGLAVGGGYLFSSSFDKTVHLWSLEDFTHIHSFKGHEHKVMAVAFVDEEQPLCISGDNGGGICIWGISIPFGEEPIKKLAAEKDWRYSGIHALTVSGNGYFYTGNGDRSIKAWSMQNYTLSCTLTGHKSVVSTLAVCNGVLYSGSWDGTVRLWCLSDHSPLTVLGEDSPGNMASVLSLSADQNMLVVGYENGHIKIWRDNLLVKSTTAQEGAVFSVCMKAMLIFTGGWSKTVTIQQLQGDNNSMDVIPIGSIACNSVITALSYWQGQLIVGQADRTIKVYHYKV